MGARCFEQASRLVGVVVRYQDAKGLGLKEYLHPARVIPRHGRWYAVVSEHPGDQLCLDAGRDSSNHGAHTLIMSPTWEI